MQWKPTLGEAWPHLSWHLSYIAWPSSVSRGSTCGRFDYSKHLKLIETNIPNILHGLSLPPCVRNSWEFTKARTNAIPARLLPCGYGSKCSKHLKIIDPRKWTIWNTQHDTTCANLQYLWHPNFEPCHQYGPRWYKVLRMMMLQFSCGPSLKSQVLYKSLFSRWTLPAPQWYSRVLQASMQLIWWRARKDSNASQRFATCESKDLNFLVDLQWNFNCFEENVDSCRQQSLIYTP